MDKTQKKMLFSILVFIFLTVLIFFNIFSEFNLIYNEKISNKNSKFYFQVDGFSESTTNKILLKDMAKEITLEDGKIAPGTSGKINLELDASKSKVDVKYIIEATEIGNKPSNLKFSAIKDKKQYTQQYSSITELAATELNGVILKEDNRNKRTLEIVWIWPFEEKTDSDIYDNEFGNGTVKGYENEFDYSFSLKIIGVKI